MIPLADYDFDSSDEFDESIVKSIDSGESSKSTLLLKRFKNVIVKSTFTVADNTALNIKKVADFEASPVSTREELDIIGKKAIVVK